MAWHWSLLLVFKGGHKNISSWIGGNKISGRQGGRKNIAGIFWLFSDIYDPPIPKKMVAPLLVTK